jgi:hypothetical protein
MWLRHTSPIGSKEKKLLIEELFSIMTRVAGPGGAPGLEDYEPSVLLYTTPRHVKITSFITCQLTATDS